MMMDDDSEPLQVLGISAPGSKFLSQMGSGLNPQTTHPGAVVKDLCQNLALSVLNVPHSLDSGWG